MTAITVKKTNGTILQAFIFLQGKKHLRNWKANWSCICHQLWIRPRSLHQNVPSSTQTALQLAWGSPAWSLLLKDSFFLTLEISDPLKQKSLNPVPPGSACRYSAAGRSQATAGAWPSPCRERYEKTSATSPEVELKLIEELTQTTCW